MKGVQKALHFGEARKIRELETVVASVNELEPEVLKLSDAELAAKTPEFQKRYDAGETLEDLLPETFAVVREVAQRTLGERHFDVQLMGGIILHRGQIAEMKTGEGKTLVATLPVYLNHFPRKGIHIVTVNDYLAKRDSEWMGTIYRFLGMDVGIIQAQMQPPERRLAYAADVTFGTNNEFGFDYLRDNMVMTLERQVQRGHHYAIIDEVDSILVDEARTPLIISGASSESVKLYRQFAQVARRLKKDADYEVDEKSRTVAVTEDGIRKVEGILGVENLYDEVHFNMVHHLDVAVKSREIFSNEVDYIIKDGEIIIVDEFTGRLMQGRRYSDGIHQAIEAKEGVRIKEESQTLATITFQNYFRMYDKLAGMTGTAATEADEFRHTYGLGTVVVPTNEPMIREDHPDFIYKTEKAKFEAVVEDIIECYERDQPVLVGTVSIEKSERLSDMLARRGIPHEVLNAKQHEREAEIVALAGEPQAIMIATNMAGRGTDIKLGEGVPELGGLKVIGTERHESRRIDNQLRGRSGRQGDQGKSRFYLSLEDDLMRRFASQAIGSLMERFNFPEDMPIEHKLVSKAIESAQKQVESQNFEVRKNLLKYDDVMNRQREVIYDERDRLIEGSDFGEVARQWVEDTIVSAVHTFTNPDIYPEDWNLDELLAYVNQVYPVTVSVKDMDVEGLTQEELIDILLEDVWGEYARREKEFGEDRMRELERNVMLEIIDNKWREHLYELDYLQDGIGLRGIAGKDPLVAYQGEAFDMFQSMTDSVKDEFARYILHAKMVEMDMERASLKTVESSGETEGKKPVQRRKDKVGRNDPCPCGSGNKYKKCCGANA
ncbi:MAG: preprotein translocase subunit SecA [Actinobacteria bacterium]|nr:preprotein translocase subunit SecA [Actinomycetota bacterium]MCG2819822.1 preprotein translocase subunit SecA [Actinomycetes bacterium]MBU4217780.1 preprotein translocase subunit SecA [Actinomycetota bacterium]MBU4358011.1 preprotein translocase subunit SecA [Actinomycetota bacterium]MBU4391831.1 preprotein translocase subunit SecA [Actinomycetota bacterium]